MGRLTKGKRGKVSYVFMAFSLPIILSQKAKLIKLIYLIGVFLIVFLPLLNLPPWFAPPDWGKAVVLRFILPILIFIFILQLLFFDKRKIFSGNIDKNIFDKKSKVFFPFWLLVALLGIYFLATIFSADINYSLWGSPYRSGGFVNYSFFIIFAILSLFIFSPKNWKRVGDFSIIMGLCVATIAIFQQFHLFLNIFSAQETQIGSTIGGPLFLGAYLLLLSFISLAQALGDKSKTKRIFYFLAFLIFGYVILLTTSQSTYLGFGAGFLWFFFFYPSNKFRYALFVKILALVLIILGIISVYYLKANPEISLSKKYSNVISTLTSWNMDQSRLSAWKVAFSAAKSKPLLGYGPENFAVGFDKFYDASLPQIGKHTYLPEDWWDRAHNFIFDISVSAGIPALIIYLSLFFLVIYKLQKVKKDIPERALISHGLQATFIGFLTTMFFSFDTFSTHLISFLLIGYSLHLINYSQGNSKPVEQKDKKAIAIFSEKSFKYGLSLILLVFIVWFIWAFSLKPFKINAQLNTARFLAQEKNQCNPAFARMDKILQEKSVLDSFVRLRYSDFLKSCGKIYPQRTEEFAKKGYDLLKESVRLQPNNTRGWLLFGGYATLLAEKSPIQELHKKFSEESNYAFSRAKILSPKRQEVYIGWAYSRMVAQDYQDASQKADVCINLNPDEVDCYWQKALAEIFLGRQEQGQNYLLTAKEKNYTWDALISLNQLARAYETGKDYLKLVDIFQTIIQKYPDQIQYRAGLIDAYKNMGEELKAKEESLKFIDVYKQLIAKFPEEPQYRASLAYLYKDVGEYEEAKKEALEIVEKWPELKNDVDAFLKTIK